MAKAILFRMRRLVPVNLKEIKGTKIVGIIWKGQKIVNGEWKDEPTQNHKNIIKKEVTNN